jgi:atypical dual specificity phosphatase
MTIIPKFENDWITNRVKAGRNPLTKKDVESLAADRITHVLDLREEDEWLPPRIGQDAIDEMAARGIARLHLPIVDMCAPSLETLETAVRFIDDALEDPKARVYVHCRAGIERTGCVLVAWHARKHGLDLDTALEELQRKRPDLSPGWPQVQLLLQWLAGSDREASSA